MHSPYQKIFDGIAHSIGLCSQVPKSAVCGVIIPLADNHNLHNFVFKAVNDAVLARIDALTTGISG
jgi:hypothetical protein